MDLLDAMRWRYATKKMDPSKSVDQEKIDRILESIRLTPSSSGLQPYQVFVISNKDLQQKIMTSARNQSQVVDSSHLLVLPATCRAGADAHLMRVAPSCFSSCCVFQLRARDPTADPILTLTMAISCRYSPSMLA